MATQKAWRLHSYGGPQCMQLDDVPFQDPGSSQVLVAVKYAALNPFDWKIAAGYLKDMMPLPLPYTLGVDFVGTVAALGNDASQFKVGDRVMAMSTSLGAFAEHIAVDESILARIPATMDDGIAATLPIPGLSAWQALHAAGKVQSGMKILIHGASGVCGALAIQFAKNEGAYVIGTASGKNRQFVMDLGADEFIDYQTQKFEDLLTDIDLIVDFVLIGGDRDSTNRSWKVLKSGGAITSIADPTITGSVPDGYRGFFPMINPDSAMLEKIAEQRASGKIKSEIARVFKRSELVQGMELNKAGGTTGRLVVDFQSD